MLPEERKALRRMRLESLLLAEISSLVAYEVKDPRCEGVVVTEVRLCKDLSSAVVLIRARHEKEDVTEEALVALTRATSFIRRELGARLCLRRVPNLKFIPDRGLVDSIRVGELLFQLRAEGKLGANHSKNGDEPE